MAEKVGDWLMNIVKHLTDEVIFPSRVGGDQNRDKRRLKTGQVKANAAPFLDWTPAL